MSIGFQPIDANPYSPSSLSMASPPGKPAVVIERQFTEVIGRAGKTECRVLRIVVDFTGRPITAFPADKFLGAAVLAVGAGTAGCASASEISFPVQDDYAKEAETYESLVDRACEPTNWVERVIDFLVDQGFALLLILRS